MSWTTSGSFRLSGWGWRSPRRYPIWAGISVALIEIMVGTVAGNTVGLTLAPWVNYLAGFGAILLTFLAGAEIDAKVVRKNLWSSLSIGVMGFFAPYLGVLLFARFVADWPWR